MVITPDAIWKLRGVVKNIVCRTHSTTSGGVWLQVTLDDQPLVEEIYLDTRSALSRANAIRRHMVHAGWAIEDTDEPAIS